jgi:hypothetical protein
MQVRYAHVVGTTPISGRVIEPGRATVAQGVTLDPHKLLHKGFRLVKVSS